ncbi:hypothetical protein NHX12_029270 [Muraenolepis orangiensis]|uniref:RING-type domain-containing protein n=1 Tax=Muraenolepis orangiensis TaxID=630683 RepID=A0A9Q0EC54_9TELE|nr:hypothetical protein NHX12_029270 [Muraenolepis orangiensis]
MPLEQEPDDVDDRQTVLAPKTLKRCTPSPPDLELCSGSLQEKKEEEMLHLQKKHKEAVKQHQVLLEKLESLRVKLQLNDSKASRKNFLLKKQEMTSQKNRELEENNRLQKELRAVEVSLISLKGEQQQEKRLLDEELSQLTAEMEKVCQSSQEAQRRVLKDEAGAVEKQRDLAMFSMDSWLREVGQYLQALQIDPSQQYLQEQLHWEKEEAAVRRSRDQLLSRVESLPGAETLPGMELPPLPKVPTVDLIISQILLSLEQAAFLPPPHPSPSPPMGPPRTQTPPRIPPNMALSRTPSRTPPPSRITPPVGHQTPPPSRITPPVGHQTPPPSRITPPVGHQTPPPSRITPPVGHQTPPPSSAPSDKLDKLLEKLGAKFPQCSRAQLMSGLHHIKSTRGTMAGLSVEEVAEQVGLKLAQDLAPRGLAPAAARGAFAGAHAPFPQPLRQTTRSFCLMCQQQVEPGSQQPLPCAHSIHRDCISVWLQSSGHNSCPFCPAQ